MFTPLVRPNSTFNMQPVENQVANTNTNGSETESLNNSTATFQEINKSSVDNTTSQNDQLAKAIAEASKSSDSGAERSEGKENDSKALSDERCKELFGSCDLLKAIDDLNSYVFKYKDGAEKIDPDADPDKLRVGVSAQELLANPVTAHTVDTEDPSGFLKVDTSQLALTTFALVSELAKRVRDIEEFIRSTK